MVDFPPFLPRETTVTVCFTTYQAPSEKRSTLIVKILLPREHFFLLELTPIRRGVNSFLLEQILFRRVTKHLTVTSPESVSIPLKINIKFQKPFRYWEVKYDIVLFVYFPYRPNKIWR